MTTATDTEEKVVLLQIADTLWSIGKGHTKHTNDKILSAINSALQKVDNPEQRELLVQAQKHFICQEEIHELEAEIAEKTAELKLLQPQVLAGCQLRYLASDLHQTLKT